MSSPTETISVGVEIHPCKSEILVSKCEDLLKILKSVYCLGKMHASHTQKVAAASEPAES